MELSFQMPQFDLDGDGFISLEEYNKQTFDFVEDPELNKDLSEEEIEHVKVLLSETLKFEN